MDRRLFLLGSTAAAAALALGACGTKPGAAAPLVLDPEIDELQERTFRWFIEATDRSNGLTRDRWPTESFASVAAVGFALAVWPVGVERGWMTREEARTRTLNTVRFFHDLPQGPEATGVGGYKGFFYHFLDMKTGHRFGQTELSTVDTALLVAGMLFAARWFDGDHAEEAEIRRLSQAIYDRIEWNWAIVRTDRISMGWHPETGHIPHDWNVYNEAMIVLLMAMGSPTHPVPETVWTEWCSVYDRSWTDQWGPAHLHFAPMFGHQYSHMFIDFRGIQDAWLRAKSTELGAPFDYFENSRRAIQAQKKYGTDNPMGWTGYSAEVWGLTACDGPGDFKLMVEGREREFFSYSARGPGARDDGTIAPTAAAGSMPFAPDDVTACVKAMKAKYGAGIYTEWGFLDSFNPTLGQAENVPALLHGKMVQGVGWVDGDYLGIDQGPIVIMTENHRSGLLWRHMHGEPNIRRAMELSGFSGGWLDA